MPLPVYAYMLAVIDHKIYILAGVPSPSDYNQIYDVQTETWSSGKSLPSAVRSASVAATTGTTAPKRICVVGRGGFFDDPSDQTYVYDPELDVWSTGALMPTPRGHPAIAIVDDVIYAIGGYYFWIEQTSAVEQYTPFGYGTVPPQISVISTENKTYSTSNVSLAFTVNKPVLWLGYSLDGQETVTITDNATLAGLASGLHNITVYAKDSFENTGTSETVYFSVEVPFPTTLVVAPVASVAVIGAVLAIYFKRYRRQCDSNDLNGDRVSDSSIPKSQFCYRELS